MQNAIEHILQSNSWLIPFIAFLLLLLVMGLFIFSLKKDAQGYTGLDRFKERADRDAIKKLSSLLKDLKLDLVEHKELSAVKIQALENAIEILTNELRANNRQTVANRNKIAEHEVLLKDFQAMKNLVQEMRSKQGTLATKDELHEVQLNLTKEIYKAMKEQKDSLMGDIKTYFSTRGKN